MLSAYLRRITDYFECVNESASEIGKMPKWLRAMLRWSLPYLDMHLTVVKSHEGERQ